MVSHGAGLYLTRCEGVRPDVSLLSLQLMSYRWYAHNASIRHPGVVFPGRSHWPDEHGYSLQKFFEANIFRRPIHVYGGNRPAETLERLLEDASLSEEQFFHWPWGLTDRMVPSLPSPPPHPCHTILIDRPRSRIPSSPRPLSYPHQSCLHLFPVCHLSPLHPAYTSSLYATCHRCYTSPSRPLSSPPDATCPPRLLSLNPKP
jgi:hypothetical protein